MKMDNLRQKREHLQSAELRLKQKILDHDKYIVVCVTIVILTEIGIFAHSNTFFALSLTRQGKTTFIVIILHSDFNFCFLINYTYVYLP